MSLRKSFMHLSTDFLKLIANKSALIAKYPSIEKDIKVMELYYLSMENLVKRYEEAIHEARLNIVNVQAHLKMMQQELRKAIGQQFAGTLSKPTAQNIKSMKKRVRGGEKNVIAKACEYYMMTDDQIRDILSTNDSTR